MNRQIFGKGLVFGIVVLLMAVAIGPVINAQFTEIKDKRMTKETVELNDDSEMGKIVVRLYEEDGKIIETVHERSLNDIEQLKGRLQNTCFDRKPTREILEEQLSILKEGDFIPEEMTLDSILRNKADIIDNINMPSAHTNDDLFRGFNCVAYFFGVGIGDAIGSHLFVQGLGVDPLVVALAYFCKLGYINFEGDGDQTEGLFLGGMLGYLGILLISIPTPIKVYSPFIFGIGYTPLMVWIRLIET